MNGKSVTLSDAAVAWVEKSRKGANFSKTLERIIHEHRGLSPAIKKQEALSQLRAASTTLAQDHNIEQEAILSWVKQATGSK